MVKNNKTDESQVPAVVFSGVCKTYALVSGESRQALEDVDFSVPVGRITVLVGPTGCGKTTLLNLAAGHVTPDKGKVTLHQDLVLGDNVSYVFQHYTLLPWLNVPKNVAFGLKLRHVRKKERTRKAGDILKQVGLDGSERALPHELSGGMRQRTAIAQALAIGPKLLLMDEPFGALDDSTRHTLQHMLIDLQTKRRMTVLFVTHNIDEAIALADRVVVFGRQGRIIDTLDITLAHPRIRTSDAFTNLFMQIRKHLSDEERS